MEELDKYIEYIKQIIQQQEAEKNTLLEEEIIMMVYIDLGYRLSFENEFYFLGPKRSKEMYTSHTADYKLNEIFKNKKIMCPSASKILKYILEKIGINIKIVVDTEDRKENHHVYNVISPKDGSEQYRVDLQSDIENIRFHTITKNFGLALDNEERYVIPLQRQKEIHERIGYVSPRNPYTEEYLYLLKYDISHMSDVYEKIEHVLTNIDPEAYIIADYWERRWRHDVILDMLFPNRELEKIIHRSACFKRNSKNEKIYLNCYFTQKNAAKPIITIYLYEQEKNTYVKYNVKEFAEKVVNENIEFTKSETIPGLNGAVNLLKQGRRNLNV